MQCGEYPSDEIAAEKSVEPTHAKNEGRVLDDAGAYRQKNARHVLRKKDGQNDTHGKPTAWYGVAAGMGCLVVWTGL